MIKTGDIDYPNGSKYQGEIIDGLPNGQGCFIDVSGDIFLGNFVDGDKHGKFLVCTRNKDRINCEFDQDAQYSDGIITYHNGNVYIGYIQELEPNGVGLMYETNGLVSKGFFKDGLLNGMNCEIYYPNGDKYIGDFIDGDAFGEGTYYYNNGVSLKGEAVSGIFKSNDKEIKIWQENL